MSSSYKLFGPYYWVGLITWGTFSLVGLMFGRLTEATVDAGGRQWAQNVQMHYRIPSFWMNITWFVVYMAAAAGAYLTWQFPVVYYADAAGNLLFIDWDNTISNTEALYHVLMLSFHVGAILLTGIHFPLGKMSRSLSVARFILFLALGCGVVSDVFAFYLWWDAGLVYLWFPIVQLGAFLNLWFAKHTAMFKKPNMVM